VGVALSLWHRHLGRPRVSPESTGAWERPAEATAGVPRYRDGMSGSFLGPRFTDEQVGAFVASHGAVARRLSRSALADEVASLLAAGKVVGLLQGRMEFGPRALGGRSIVGDPRSPKMQSVMNLKIKFRESFRPFAPAVLRERVADWFELDGDSPYMLLVADVRKQRRLPERDDANATWGIDRLNVPRSTIPAVTHVDYSARIQTVRRETNPFYYDLIEAFDRLTGCPVIVNTSFNVRGEPIVCTPADAYRCFMRTNMDALVLENHLLRKGEQPASPESADESWRAEFVLD
jgi:carbamoyltransferase